MTSLMYFRAAAVSPQVKPAAVDFNIRIIKDCLLELDKIKVDLAVFPELSITSYTCADLFNNSELLDSVKEALDDLRNFSRKIKTAFIIGYPLPYNGALYNVASVVHNGQIRITQGKKHIPNYSEFYERRWFEPWAQQSEIYELNGVKIGIEICEDLWVPDSPSIELCSAGVDIIANPSASDDIVCKYDYLKKLISIQSAKTISGYIYTSAGFGESSTDLVFDGKGIIAENGKILCENKRWNRATSFIVCDIDIEALRHDKRRCGYFTGIKSPNIIKSEKDSTHNRCDNDIERKYSPLPFVPDDRDKRSEHCSEIIAIQSAALTQRLNATHCDKLVVGISGGLDSTLALLIACNTFENIALNKKNILAISMPCFGTSARTLNNAKKLCESLGVSYDEISISETVKQHLKDIRHDINTHDTTYENAQARIRTLVLMNLANKVNGMVLGTGDLSESALGWATYNGDHMSMYNVNAGIPKTLVKYLVEYFSDSNNSNDQLKDVLKDIIDTPISPELLPPDADNKITQKTEDIIGPYELHDFFIYYTLRYGFGPEKISTIARLAFYEKYSPEKILLTLKKFYQRFFSQQFKRSCMPDGPKVGTVSLSPRGDWRMPSDASSEQWILQVDKLIERL